MTTSPSDHHIPGPPAASADRPRKPRWSLPAAAALLILFTASAYFPALQGDFVFDDGAYVLNNPNVAGGLTQESVRWAFTTFYGGNWHPLAWLSHMLDAQLFGLRPWGHHLVNVLVHLANCLLLLQVLYMLTGALWRSVFVAAVFALHPMHVESVAWVAERKDVLSACFFLLSLWAYRRYVGRPSALRYAGVLAFFLFGLMSKSMVATLPFVLLLLDWWPLGRFETTLRFEERGRMVRPFMEKLPMFALSAVVAAITYFAQRNWGATALESFSFPIRIANALVAYIRYIFKLLLPGNLAVFYPHPGVDLPMWKAGAAFLILTGVTLLFLKIARLMPFLTMGWFWYLGMLVPVIGLVQVGSQGMADRYTYLPSLGLFIALAWGLGEVFRGQKRCVVPISLAATLIVAVLGVLTWKQTRYWRDDLMLFGHAAAVVPDSWQLHNNYGHELMKRNRPAEAANEFEAAVRLRPEKPGSHNNLALALEGVGRQREAIDEYLEALRHDPKFLDARLHVATLFVAQREFDKADRHLREALRINPGSVEAHFLLADLLAKQGRHPEAIGQYLEALHLRPGMADAYLNSGNSYSDMGREEEAITMYQAALRANPASDKGHFNMGLSLERLGRHGEAEVHLRQAIEINPHSIEAVTALDRVLQLRNR